MSDKAGYPDDVTELSLLAAGAEFVVGMDEVGRGAVAGPVAVGALVFTAALPPAPEGVRDSKLLSEKRRVALDPLVRAWAPMSAVGWAAPDEVDARGIGWCLAESARRALAEITEAGFILGRGIVLLDGSHDWLSPALREPVPVVTRVKADRDCVSVAAASIVAKVARDTFMIEAERHHPQYVWGKNKGYASAAHREALREHGPSPLHRLTWLHG